VVYKLTDNDGRYEIRWISAGNGDHEVNFSFSSAVPVVTCSKDGASVEGRFLIESDETTGSIAGMYRVTRHGNQVDMTLQPTSEWRPRERKLSVRLIYAAIPIFKQWVNTSINGQQPSRSMQPASPQCAPVGARLRSGLCSI